jgi:hypothetical protein
MVQKWPVKFLLGSNGTTVTFRPLPDSLFFIGKIYLLATNLMSHTTSQHWHSNLPLFSLQILSNHVQQSAMEADVGSEEIDHPHKMFSSTFLISHCFVKNEEH